MITSKIINFLKNRSDDNTIEYYYYPNEGIDYKLPFTCHYKMKYLGEELNSWGNGKDINDASFKGLMELLERFCYHSFSHIKFKNNYGYLMHS